MPKVSVIVPVYNTVNYIRECMDSLVNQTLQDIEIIPVDAGSTDGTLEILEEYRERDSRVRIIQSREKSVGYQNNLGIASAQGMAVGFCEADDYVDTCMYEKLWKVLDKENLDYVKTDFDMFVTRNGGVTLRYRILNGYLSNLYGNVISPKYYPEIIHRDVNMWNGLYKKKFLVDNKILQNTTPKAAFQDTGFVLQTLCYANKVMYISIPANFYRRDNIKSSVYDPDGIKFVINEFTYYINYIRKNNIKHDIDLAIIRRFFDMFCGYYRKLPPKESLDSITTEMIYDFINKFKYIYKDLHKNILRLENLDSSISCRMLIENRIDDFDIFQRYWMNMEKEKIESFLSVFVENKDAVIFGAGEVGTSCYALLKNNGYTGRLVFCDNDTSKWNTVIMDAKLFSPNDVFKKYGDRIFIVANDVHKREIYKQILSMGINEKNIYFAPGCIPHLALEIRKEDL